MYQVGEKDRCIQGFGGETRGRDHLKDPSVDGRIIIKQISDKWDGGWTESIWLRTNREGGLLWMR